MVERAAGFEVGAGALQRDALGDDFDDVAPRADFLEGLIGEPGHCYLPPVAQGSFTPSGAMMRSTTGITRMPVRDLANAVSE